MFVSTFSHSLSLGAEVHADYSYTTSSGSSNHSQYHGHQSGPPPPDVVPGHMNRPKNRLHEAVKINSREASGHVA